MYVSHIRNYLFGFNLLFYPLFSQELRILYARHYFCSLKILRIFLFLVRRIVEGNKKKEQKGQAEEEAMTEPNSLDEIVYAAEDVVDAVEETTRGFFGLFKFKR